MITSNIPYLTQTNVWSTELKDVLNDELTGQGYVRWIPFPTADVMNIPSIGEGTVRNYVEDTAAVYDSLDTGNFTFSISEYIQSGNYITDKAAQDLFYAAELQASFVPKEARAIAEYVETQIFRLGAAGARGGQTAASTNSINGGEHRWVANGSAVNSTEFPMALKDFSKALFSLKKANVPGQGLIAIVDPSVEYTFNNLTNLISPSSSSEPMWGDLLQSGLGSGPRFVRNIFGFDIYVSNYLAPSGANGYKGIAATESINGVASGANAVCNIFMSAADQRLVPFIGAWRQPPRVESKRNIDYQRTEFLTTARFGLKVFRPENLITVLSSTAVIA